MNYQDRFLSISSIHRVLQFGEFTLKSGRKSPYFFNLGNFYTGIGMKEVASAFCAHLLRHHPQAEVVFGPAYKGIPLASNIVVEMSYTKGQVLTFCANRKEIKDHGDGGILLGDQLKISKRVVIVDDVITSGSSIREAIELIHSKGSNVVGVATALDRGERDDDGKLPAAELAKDYPGLIVSSILSVHDLDRFVRQYWEDKDDLQRFLDYKSRYVY